MKKKLVRAGLLFCAGIITLSFNAHAQHKSPVLNHIAIAVYDLDKATAFYRDVMEIDTLAEPFHDGKHTWLKIGPHSQLHLIKAAREVSEHDIAAHLCFSVPSIDDFIIKLNKLNIPFRNWQGEKQKYTLRVDGVKQVYLQDPDKYWVEVNDDKY
ncbi:VOC family protein [Chitinophaga sp. GbtcB8]|uniref:VOC family protein n=1 Tax=Chitinophaga sp. GbtcB8 TaxID=2824753 RepID=UPI001C2FB3E5|nr:VOC family protein [Chitinophaga sp. GbtcB8]